MAAAVNAAPMPPVNPAGAASYSMASLYVGDLHPDVTESMLFDKFSTAGPVLSIRVCRDAITRRSLGYAYVNFQQPADAERALDTMNFDVLNGKPIRIMWSNRDPSTRRAGTGNIFIKNLDKTIDNKAVYDTFSLFGNILSCKVALDESGNSKGYGFVHFETEEAAQRAIDKVNNMLLVDKQVFVGKFQTRAVRQKEIGETGKKYTNVFVKNFGEELDQEKLQALCEKYGEITSIAVATDAEGKSRGYGFVAFADAECAEKAVEALNDLQLDGTDKKLYAGRAQKKGERSAELKRKFEAAKAERMQRYAGVNLYVKNLDDTVDDELLRQKFEEFGKITSAKVMTDENNRSKGFGFVCFEKAEEATKAVTEMNSKIICSKPLYVALAQRKDDRRAQLASQYMQRLANMRLSGPMPTQGMYGGAGGFYVSQPIPNQRGNFMQGAGMPAAMRGPQRWNGAMPTQQFGQPPFIVQAQGYQRGGRPGQPPTGQPRPQQYQQQPQQQGVPQRSNQPQRVTAPFPQNGRSNNPNNQIVVGGQEPLTSHVLAQASPQEQKQMLGERIYTLIEKMYTGGQNDAGKITGMMLEMDNSELIMILQDNDLFRNKVEEAANVLKQAGPK
ncbi:unnamed protein product, partial [Mesorhabditis spiculigera]